MEEHPGILFRDGPSGRRAALIAGPDVWEVVRVVQSARAAEPDLDADAVVRLAAETMGLPPARARVALAYWAAHPDEIEQRIHDADQADRLAEEHWQRPLRAGHRGTRGDRVIGRLRGRAISRLTTDEILGLTRDPRRR